MTLVYIFFYFKGLDGLLFVWQLFKDEDNFCLLSITKQANSTQINNKIAIIKKYTTRVYTGILPLVIYKLKINIEFYTVYWLALIGLY